MKALFLTAIGQTEIREIEKPSIGPEEVLLKIGMVGFCGGDLNGFKGLFELQEYPNVLGHEVGGTIEAMGSLRHRARPGLGPESYPRRKPAG